MDHEPSKKGRLVIDPTSYASPSSESALTEAQMVGVPHPGDEILGGKYEVERIIGVGGMGVVVAAFHKQLGQRVAIKFLSRQMQTVELVDRFIREGQACARIKSEHIANVLDVGVLETGTPYLMMEYLEGIDLDEYIEQHGAIPIQEAVEFVLQACDALAVAHSAGIVHRDLKPSNLFVTRRSDGSPLIKVLDFGISKIGATEEIPNPKSTLTRPGTMLGSPRYVSPEQLRNASDVDHRADIWAIGIVLHELVVGHPPFVSDTFADLCTMITTRPPVPLRQLVPHAPEELETAIFKCIEKAPESRFQNVAELAKALAPIAAEESKAIALRVAKILEVARSSGGSLYPQSHRSGITPRRQIDVGRLDPTVARSASRRGASIPTDSQVSSALSVSGTPFSRGWGARLGGIALLIALVASITALVVAIRRARPAGSSTTVATTNALPPTVIPLPPPPAETAAPAPAPVATSPTSVTETEPVPVAPPASAVRATPKAPPKAPPKARPKASAPSAPNGGSSAEAPPQPNEADMLNRRR